jgi:hypothetical protein
MRAAFAVNVVANKTVIEDMLLNAETCFAAGSCAFVAVSVVARFAVRAYGTVISGNSAPIIGHVVAVIALFSCIND